MPFPASTDWPGAYDPDYGSGSQRVDNADIVWAYDYNFPDTQIRKLQQFLGVTGKMLGEDLGVGYGPGGIVSPVASGGDAIKLVAWNDFVAGYLLVVQDDYNGTPDDRLLLRYDGLLWTSGGADFSAAEFLRIPHGNADPLTFDEGRLFYRDDLNTLFVADGTGWVPVGSAGSGSYLDWSTGYQYTQAVVPVEEVIGQGFFDGSLVTTGAVYFRTILDTVYAGAPGPSVVSLYDMGPKAGPPVAPTLITALVTAVPGGPQVLEQVLAIGVAPGANQIANSARMYEITALQLSAPGDSVYVGCAGLDVR